MIAVTSFSVTAATVSSRMRCVNLSRLAVAWSVDTAQPVVGPHSLGAGAVPMVDRIVGPDPASREAQMVTEIGAKRPLDQCLLERDRGGVDRVTRHRPGQKVINQLLSYRFAAVSVVSPTSALGRNRLAASPISPPESGRSSLTARQPTFGKTRDRPQAGARRGRLLGGPPAPLTALRTSPDRVSAWLSTGRPRPRPRHPLPCSARPDHAPPFPPRARRAA